MQRRPSQHLLCAGCEAGRQARRGVPHHALLVHLHVLEDLYQREKRQMNLPRGACAVAGFSNALEGVPFLWFYDHWYAQSTLLQCVDLLMPAQLTVSRHSASSQPMFSNAVGPELVAQIIWFTSLNNLRQQQGPVTEMQGAEEERGHTDVHQRVNKAGICGIMLRHNVALLLNALCSVHLRAQGRVSQR